MSRPLRSLPIYILSDGTGDTAEKVVRAALLQFSGYLVHLQVHPNITEPDQLDPLFRRAADEGALVVITLVRPVMRARAQELAQDMRLRMVDVLDNLLSQLGTWLGGAPQGRPGLMHQPDEDYFRRVEAVEFTVKADDGKEPRLLQKADIILVGVSRTSKTPLSVFLAHKGFKVSNVPVVLDQDPPAEVYEIDQRRVFGLTIDPESLRDIRRTRLATMRMSSRTNYGDMDYILAELEWAEELFRRNPGWPVIDVTRKAVEETAAMILRILAERGIGRDIGEVGQL
jgi:regulator of PEP synthase PpsR (kinase-PPPase family)